MTVMLNSMTIIHNFQDTISFIKICIEFPALFGITDTLERVFHGRTGIILRPLYLSGGKSAGRSHPFQDALHNETDKSDTGCHHKGHLIGRGFGDIFLYQRSFHWAIRFSKNELMPSLASSVLQSLAKASFM